jgi:hypothetical protein
MFITILKIVDANSLDGFVMISAVGRETQPRRVFFADIPTVA